jgi:hypothetical protein
MAAKGKFVSDWSIKKYSPLKILSQMNRNLLGSIIDATYQISVHLAKRFQRRILFSINQPETIIAYDGHDF